MTMLNRWAVVVVPREPVLAWVNSVCKEAPVTMDQLRSEPSVYLVRDPMDDDKFERELRKVYPSIFEEELEGWYTDRECWPQNRTWELFREWFEVTVHSAVYDVGRRGAK